MCQVQDEEFDFGFAPGDVEGPDRPTDSKQREGTGVEL